MDLVLIIAALLIATLAVAQGSGAFILRRKLLDSLPLSGSNRDPESTAAKPLPKSVILLSLRGADPDLAFGIEALARQNHPDYRVVIVVDSEQDAAWRVLEPIIQRIDPQRLTVQTLKSHSPLCGLKCSALAQAYRSLESDVEIIALVDADIVVHPNWLRSLTAPLADPQVAITTGAQWFEPADTDAGTWMRSIWNAGASVPTILLGHAWAGSCAMRRQDIEAWKLIELWEKSIIDDGPIAVVAAQSRREIRFVPDAWMINRERCSRRFVGTYLRRMLTWSRLYETTYPLTVAHAVGTVALWGVCWIGLWSGLVSGLPHRQWLGAVPALLFWLSAVIGYYQVRRTAAQVVSWRGETLEPRGFRDFLRIVWLVPATYLLYAWASIAALFVRRILWRGVEYRLEPDGVRMTHYQPYLAAASGIQGSVCTPRIVIQPNLRRTPNWAIASLITLALFQSWVLTQSVWTPRYAPAIRPNPLAENPAAISRGNRLADPMNSLPVVAIGSQPSVAETPEGTSEDPAANPVEHDSKTAEPTTAERVAASQLQQSSHRIITDRETIERQVQRWDELIQATQDVSGILLKQERIDGRLEPLTRLEFRQLSNPLCVYLKWIDVHAGREVLFRREASGETMVARQETVLGALVPNFSLTKDHPFTRTVSRHPIDELSLEFLRTQLRRYINQAKRNPEALIELELDTHLGDRRVQRIAIVHPRRSELAPSGYHRTDMYFDAETEFPVRWEKYHWPDWKGDERFDPDRPADVAPLIEYFELVEFQRDQGLTTEDFATENPAYGFGRSNLVPLP